MAWFNIEKAVQAVTKVIATAGLMFADEDETLQIRKMELLIEIELATLALQNTLYEGALNSLKEGAIDFEEMDRIKESILKV